jgi:HTH-type transcriptional regulator/antitoxin HigA
MKLKAAKASAPRFEVADDYLDLVKELPLRPIKSKREHAAAQAILDRLIGRSNLTKGQRDYLDALVHFVTDYEQANFTSRLDKLKPLELLKHLLEENEMNTTDLGYILGSRGLASEVLNGNRGLSKTLIKKLSARFAVDPALFLES